MKREQTSSDWERIVRVLDYSGLSVHALALKIGLKRPENLYNLRRGNTHISRELAQRIHKVFPHFTVAWLLSGDPEVQFEYEPERLRIGSHTIRKIPFYQRFSDFYASGEISPAVSSIYLPASLAKNADFAMVNNSGEMAPKIPCGAVMLLRDYGESIIYGRFYLVTTPDHTLLRIVRRTPTGLLRLVAGDRELYDDIYLPVEAVKAAWLVRTVIFESV